MEFKQKSCYCIWINIFSQPNISTKKLIVDASGNGNFLSIQAAINSLTDSAAKPRTILIKKGIYKEKIFLSKHNVVLEGEDKVSTIITQSIARDEFRCTAIDDWGQQL